MPDSPGSCANTVGADGAGMAPPVKASVKSAYVHRPDSTQYHPEGEGGTKPKPASVGRAYVHQPDSTQYHQEGEGGTKPKPRSEEHTSELQAQMRISYAVDCLKNK